MIYSNDFIWLHFPKCAGTTIAYLFSRYFSSQKNLSQDPVGARLDPTVAWHDSISERMKRDPKFKSDERVIIVPFRKLSSWIVSRYNFEVERSPNLNHCAELLLEGKFLEANGKTGHADNYVKKYLPASLLHSSKIKFLRTEYFKSDFQRIFGQYLDISVIPEREFKKRRNSSANHVPGNVLKRLKNNKQLVYDSCPYWRSIEDIAYNQLNF
jgi:hypothetical protein